MINTLHILIMDSNSFFAYGLKKILINHCNSRGVRLIFTSNPSDYLLADISFLSQNSFIKWINKPQLTVYSSSASIFVHIASFRNESLDTTSGAQCVFKRNQSCTDFLALVDNVLDRNTVNATTTMSTQGQLEILTRREKEVMYYFSKGFSQAEIGGHLKISPKTVSTHKRCVMKKLGFTRLAELHNWLLYHPANLIRGKYVR